MFAADAKFAIHAPRTTTFGTKHTQVMFHGDQHDVRIFQTEVTFRLALVKRTLAFGVRVQRVVAVWVLIVGIDPSSQRRLIGNVSMIVILPAR